MAICLIIILVPRGRAPFGQHQESRPLASLARSNTGSPRFADFPSLCACSESSLTNLIGCDLNLLCLQSHSKTECRWTGPEVTSGQPLARSNTGSPRFADFPSLCACSESSLTNLIGCDLNLLCLQSHSKTECRWTGPEVEPEVAILGADQKERGLWGRECLIICSF